jgi:hypothetical protein
MHGWGANLVAALRLYKGNILSEIQTLDLVSDSVGLTAEEWTHRYALETSLMEIYKGEESFWRQRIRHNWILKGDADTAYFHAVANGHFVENAPFRVCGITTVCWRIIVIFPRTLIPFIRNFSRRHLALGWH